MSHIFKSKFTSLLCTLGLVLFSGTAPADDTDIYYNNAQPVVPGGEPIVMLSIDWRPNLGAPACSGDECQFLIDGGYLAPAGPYVFFDVLRAALKMVLEPLDGVRVGLMLNHDYKNNCENDVSIGCSNGGYMALGAELFMEDDANDAKARFHQFLTDMPVPRGVASHAYQGSELFFELYRYLTGQRVWNGHVGFLDYQSDEDKNLDEDNPEIMWDTNIESVVDGEDVYNSPLQNFAACSSIYTVNFMFQVSQQEDNSDDEIEKTVAEGGLNLEQRGFPDVIEWLNDADLGDGAHGAVADIAGTQNVTSYFVIDPRFINTTTTKYAQAGGTNTPIPFSDDPGELVAAITEIFRQILSVSTTFVAASVPVNTFNRAEIEDNVYIALFRVDRNGAPVWEGNVKKLKITGLSSGVPAVIDTSGNPAFAPDGRLRYDALTYWTDSGALPVADPDENEVDGRDGRHVARGGMGQIIPGYISGSLGDDNGAGTRQLYYDDGPGTMPGLNVSAAAALSGDLNALSLAEAEDLIRYARGQDVDDLDGDTNTTEARDWLVSDILHSKPLPLNYGERGTGYDVDNPAIYIAAGSNDGYMRFIRNTDGTDAESGEEVWAFMPRAVMGKLQAMRANGLGARHQYAVDGPPVAYMEDRNANGSIDAGEKAYLIFGLRRGGQALYAIDVSDPESPELLWTIDKTTSGFSELGYTFGAPRIIMTREGGTLRPVVAFSGGYDLNKDDRSSVGTDDSEGNAIYVAELETGNLLWKAVGSGARSASVFPHAGLVDSIAAPLTILDSDGDSDHDRLYVGDTGGNVWRADIEGEIKSNWKLTLLARLGRHSVATPTKADDRRFFHRADVVQSLSGGMMFDSVLLGSGDRADPLDAAGMTENYAYMIKDLNTLAGGGLDGSLVHSDPVLGDVSNTCLETGSPCLVDLTRGWKMNLSANGEKQLSKPVTILGTTFFTTYVPGNDPLQSACEPAEGGGRLYAVSFLNGAAQKNYDTTTSELERFTELTSSGIPAEVVPIPEDLILRPDGNFENVGGTARIETFWFQQEDSDL